jgi:hypothetical protein
MALAKQGRRPDARPRGDAPNCRREPGAFEAHSSAEGSAVEKAVGHARPVRRRTGFAGTLM